MKRSEALTIIEEFKLATFNSMRIERDALSAAYPDAAERYIQAKLLERAQLHTIQERVVQLGNQLVIREEDLHAVATQPVYIETKPSAELAETSTVLTTNISEGISAISAQALQQSIEDRTSLQIIAKLNTLIAKAHRQALYYEGEGSLLAPDSDINPNQHEIDKHDRTYKFLLAIKHEVQPFITEQYFNIQENRSLVAEAVASEFRDDIGQEIGDTIIVETALDIMERDGVDPVQIVQDETKFDAFINSLVVRVPHVIKRSQQQKDALVKAEFISEIGDQFGSSPKSKVRSQIMSTVASALNEQKDFDIAALSDTERAELTNQWTAELKDHVQTTPVTRRKKFVDAARAKTRLTTSQSLTDLVAESNQPVSASQKQDRAVERTDSRKSFVEAEIKRQSSQDSIESRNPSPKR